MTSTPAGDPPGRRRALIFDADDTLWHNNALFERVIEAYLDWLVHPTLGRQQVRAVLDAVEAANVGPGGYGAQAFLRNLAQTLQRVHDRPVTAAEEREIEALAQDLLRHDIELLPGVGAVLDELAARHDLYLLTKGDPVEQQRKVTASGLAHHFRAVHIVAEKDPGVYREVVARHRLDPGSTWMIGNSPRSDILPARAAGLNAVYIPQATTWLLEQAELDPADDRILLLGGFSALLEHF